MNRYSRSLVVDGKVIPWTFKLWLWNFKKAELPIGSLAVDILKDKKFPDTESFDEIIEYLQSQTDDPEISETFKLVWDFYQSSTRVNHSV
ncbi:YozE family protein [Paenibacillus xylanexedens]|uniref:YozE family protein n=1 Tax=Paenibacillus xylanexedens TaxID=528191 RepID=UPI003D088371